MPMIDSLRALEQRVEEGRDIRHGDESAVSSIAWSPESGPMCRWRGGKGKEDGSNPKLHSRRQLCSCCSFTWT